jgi:PKD repeat protein
MVSANPVVTFTMVNSAPQVWDAYATFTGGTGPFSYQWTWGDGTASTMQYPSHTYSTPGWYNICCTITDANGCTGTACSLDSLYKTTGSMITLNVVNGSMAVASHTSEKTSIYPNPANNSFTVEAPLAEQTTLQLFDLSGRSVRGETFKGKTTIETSSLEEGVYMLRVKSSSREITKKLVVVH